MNTKARTWFRAFSTASLLTLSVVLPVHHAQADEPGPVEPIEFNPALAELGKRLFFDPRLSGDTELSCASCHQPDKGFTDGQALSDAYAGNLHFRNVPTLINSAKRAAWFHDGRIGTNLNDVTRESITETYSMNMDMRLMQERLKQDPVYVEMFAAAGLGEPSNGGVRKAIPEYLKTLISRGAPFDTGEMSQDAKDGYVIFKAKGCNSCHSGERFTDDKPHNIGVPENPEIWSTPERHITFVAMMKFLGLENYMNVRQDPGAYIRTHQPETYGGFITPTLRELTHTAPYMHNGTMETLADVVAFYNEGGGDDPNKDPRLKPLGLSEWEQRKLVAFLESLSGDPLTGPEFVVEEIDTDYEPIENWLEAVN
ncbi:cytochrome c peroxidase [Ruegeria intermedia]|uniref:Cytochrome c peroxidase n=1 Tax=Ruegeria intermedia TaxID=996115 RepID=A0A1M4ZQ48_9RHOB|nr:cytochrome c peroxidase [Ruegeria intermedia]SHF20131.1 cytochrome c peroxidase [Ruegeria intermedia]